MRGNILKNQHVGSINYTGGPTLTPRQVWKAHCRLPSAHPVWLNMRLVRRFRAPIILSVSLSLVVKAKGLQIGFDLVGIAPLAAWRDLQFSRKWVEQGYSGEMRYLENPKRQDPRSILASAKSVVCVGMVYNAALPYSTEVVTEHPPAPDREDNGRGESGGPRAWISRYAWGRDYHDIMRKKLEQLRAAVESLAPGVETRVYVDTGPIVERAFARLSGIGWMGKNTCLINERKGSWFFLGVMLISLELDPDLPASDRCGSCTRCIEACPTGALVEPYVMDASRCIAYFTIELKGAIPAQFRPAIGANVFGCDICQDVCPWNLPRRAAVTSAPQFQPTQIIMDATPPEHRFSGSHGERSFSPWAFTPKEKPTMNQNPDSSWLPAQWSVEGGEFSLLNPPIEALASLSEEDFRRIFARSPIKRAKYPGWLRNLCVAMGNSGDVRFVPWLEHAREFPNQVVREQAEWALSRLQKAEGRGSERETNTVSCPSLEVGTSDDRRPKPG